MAKRGHQISLGLILVSIVAILLSFLYAAYVGLFSPSFVSAVATSGLVLVTAVSVILTISLLNEQSKARKQEIIPAFKLGTKGIALGKRGIIARNIGNGPAQNIEVTVTVQPQNIETSFEYPNVATGEILPIGDPFSDDFDLEQVDKIAISGECEDIMGEIHHIWDEEAVRDISSDEYILTRDTQEKSLKDISNEVKKIRKELRNLDKSLR